jgi:cytoskeletal protein CcmA (bactofilin family)/nitrate reductase NapE component
MRRHLLTVSALATIMLIAVASPASAARAGSARDDRRISVSGGVVVAQGEVVNGPVVSIDGPATIDGTADDVYVGSGRVVIRGRVTGDVFVLHGDVLITGRVGSDVVALDGRITVRDGARVSGDVRSREQPNVAPGTVRGEVKKLNIGNLFRGFVIAFLIVLWIAVTVSVGILGLVFVLLFPRAADATEAAGRRFGPTLGWGALVGVVGPIVGVLVLVTVVGIPFGLGILSALNVLAPLGYVATSLVLGRLMVKGASTGERIGAFFAGFGILRAVALIPGLGFIVWFLACIYGLGALTRAAWRAGREPSAEGPPAAPAPEPLPTASPGAPADEAPPAQEQAPTTPAG